jgi:hypothetical protein
MQAGYQYASRWRSTRCNIKTLVAGPLERSALVAFDLRVSLPTSIFGKPHEILMRGTLPHRRAWPWQSICAFHLKIKARFRA